jgi:hypothetical protein
MSNPFMGGGRHIDQPGPEPHVKEGSEVTLVCQHPGCEAKVKYGLEGAWVHVDDMILLKANGGFERKGPWSDHEAVLEIIETTGREA